MIFKSTTTLHQATAEQQLGDDLQRELTKEWKDLVTNQVDKLYDGFMQTIPTEEEDVVYIQVFKNIH